MPPTPLPERTFTRKLASHAFVAAAGVALGSLLGFYQGQRSYEQEECVRRGMEVRFVEDFPQYQNDQKERSIKLYGNRVTVFLGDVITSYSTGRVIASDDTSAPLALLQQAAKRGREAEQTLERECAENSWMY